MVTVQYITLVYKSIARSNSYCTSIKANVQPKTLLFQPHFFIVLLKGTIIHCNMTALFKAVSQSNRLPPPSWQKLWGKYSSYLQYYLRFFNKLYIWMKVGVLSDQYLTAFSEFKSTGHLPAIIWDTDHSSS